MLWLRESRYQKFEFTFTYQSNSFNATFHWFQETVTLEVFVTFDFKIDFQSFYYFFTHLFVQYLTNPWIPFKFIAMIVLRPSGSKLCCDR